jgi:hypothetical protein
MRKIITTLLVGLYSITAYCQHGFVINLKHIATITFPDSPQYKQSSHDTVYVAVSKTGAIYLAEATHVQKSVKELFNKHVLDSIYNGVIIGTLSSSHGKVLYKKNILVNNLNGIEFGYTVLIKNQIFFGYNQVFYLNKTLINYGLWSKDSLKSDSKPLKVFFGTFKLTVDADDVRQDNSTEMAFNIGYVIGIVMVIGVIVLFGLIIVFIIKRLTR